MEGKVLKLDSGDRSVTISFDKFVSLLKNKFKKNTIISQVPLLIWSTARAIDGDTNAINLLLSIFSSNDEVAEGLSNSKVIHFRGIGHDVIDNNLCARALTADFIADPDEPLPQTKFDIKERENLPPHLLKIQIYHYQH